MGRALWGSRQPVGMALTLGHIQPTEAAVGTGSGAGRGGMGWGVHRVWFQSGSTAPGQGDGTPQPHLGWLRAGGLVLTLALGLKLAVRMALELAVGLADTGMALGLAVGLARLLPSLPVLSSGLAPAAPL